MSSAQTMQPSLELHSLGWKAFQQLCVTICSEIFGQTVQNFLDANDGGRDGAFQGLWTPKQGDDYSGSFTIQCKFSQRSNQAFRLSSIKSELEKAERLAARGLADNYFILTNMSVSGSSDEDIKSIFENIPNIRRCTIFGSEKLSQIIRESPRLRMLVPRVYGLGDLSQIVDERAYEQAQDILSAMGGDMAKFVITGAHQTAAEAIVRHGLVLLLGEPACGKSAIAAALALGAWDEWGCATIKARNADEVVRHLNPHEKQFFWVDDAFGATQLDWNSTASWNSAFPHLQAAIKRGTKFVLTSRDYIYRAASRVLKQSSLPVIKEAQIVIYVEKLTKDEKEQILYNHIRLGSQARKYKTEIKPHLSKVAAHPRFSPEIARRLGNEAFTKGLIISETTLADYVNRPMAFLQENISTIDRGSLAALALVFMNGNAMKSPVTLNEFESEAISRLGATVVEFRRALPALEGSFLLNVSEKGASYWKAKHPTVLDALAGIISKDPELLYIYFKGTPTDKLFSEVSCDEARSTSSKKLTIPSHLYGAVIDKVLDSIDNGDWQERSAANRFIAFECGKGFFSELAKRRPNFTGQLRVHSYLNAVSDVDVINKLYELQLLSEADRVRFRDILYELAIETPDDGFLSDVFVAFITDEEREDIFEHVKRNLLPNLNQTIEQWRYNCDDDASSYFSTLEETLETFKRKIVFEPELTALINKALAEIQEVVGSMQRPDRDDDEYFAGRHAALPAFVGERSVFDDVDE